MYFDKFAAVPNIILLILLFYANLSIELIPKPAVSLNLEVERDQKFE
jgi:hypothetical protein